MKERIKFITAACIITAVAAAIPFVCSEKLTQVSYRIASRKLSEEVRIVFLSDVHNSAYGRDMSELTDSTDRFSPDIVIFGGDLFDQHWGEPNSVKLVEKLAAKYPCFYALGNHEFNSSAAKVKEGMRALGVTVLDGGFSDIDIRGQKLRIFGIDGVIYKDQLAGAAENVTDERFGLMIEHYPTDFPVLCTKGFDLVLSGHEHGGQMRVPYLINGLFAPDEGLFPKYAGGLYEKDGTTMIVSRGLCKKPRDIVIPRVFNRPETVFITLGGKA